MTNLYKSNKNGLKNSVKLKARSSTEKITNETESNFNIKNLNFSLNDNKNDLNQIVLNSEENVYGFKNIYTLASLPHKIVNIKNKINNINNKVQKNNIQMNYEIKKIRESFVANKTIGYSNSIRTENESIINPLNFTNTVSKYNNTLSENSNKKYNEVSKGINDTFLVLIGISGTATIGVMGFASVASVGIKVQKILPVIKANKENDEDLTWTQVFNWIKADKIPTKKKISVNTENNVPVTDEVISLLLEAEKTDILK